MHHRVTILNQFNLAKNAHSAAMKRKLNKREK